MANRIIQILRGLKASKPSLHDGEFYLEKDTSRLVIQNGNTELPLANQSEITGLQTSLNETNTNVASIADTVATKQDKLTFDTAPTANSINPVTSGGVLTALNGKAPTNHASTAITYGVGTGTNYGHLTLSDSTINTNDVTKGQAATPKAVNSVFTQFNSYKTSNDAEISSLRTDIGNLPIKSLVGTAEAPIELNDLLEPGIYYISGEQTVDGATTNELISSMFLRIAPLFVYKNGNLDSNIIQYRIDAVTGKIVVRRKVGTTWSNIPITAFLTMNSGGEILEIPNSGLSFSSKRLRNIANPTSSQDASTKNYVDTSISGLPVKSLVGTTEAPIDIDTLVEPGIYFISGTQKSTAFPDDTLLSKSFSDAPLEVVKITNTDNTVTISQSRAYGVTVISRLQNAGTWATSTTQRRMQYESNGNVIASPATLTFSNTEIKGLATPTTTTSATNKSYVDTQIATRAPTSHASTVNTYGLGNASNYGHLKLSDSVSTTSGVTGGIAATPTAIKSVNDALNTYKTSNDSAVASKLPLAGGTITGNLTVQGTLTGTLTGNATSATKATQDGNGAVIASTYLKLSGGTMTGNLAMGNKKITGLAAPTATTDAATKTYVDTAVAGAGGTTVVTQSATPSGLKVGDLWYKIV